MADTTTLTDEQKIAMKHFGKDVDATPAKTEEEIAAEKDAEEKRIAAEAKTAEEARLAEEEKNKVVNTTEPAKVELTDEELMELVAKKSGRKLTSWDDLKSAPTEEDKKKLEESRDSEKLSFGLKKGLFNKNQYESFIADSKNPKDLVYARELAEAKADDQEWDADKEKEFKEEFEEKFGLNLDPTASKSKRGQKQLNLIAESILKKEYGSIFQLDAEYGKYESERNTVESRKQKVLSEAPAYRENVTKVLADFSKVEMKFGTEIVEVPVSADIIKEVTDVMLDNGFSTDQILKGYKKENLSEFVKQYIRGQYFDQLSFEAAKKYHEKHEKGVRGIPTGGALQKVEDGADLTDKQKEALQYFKGQPKSVAN